MIQVFCLNSCTEAIRRHIEDLPAIADGDEFENYSVAELSLRWELSDAHDADLSTNVVNWQKIVQSVDESCKLKTEADANKVVLVASSWPQILEAREEFFKSVANEKGMGPKRMAVLRKLCRVWIPFSRKVKNAGGDRNDRLPQSGYRKPNNPNWKSKWEGKTDAVLSSRRPSPAEQFKFIRWIGM